MGELKKPLTIYMLATWFLFNVFLIIMWMQRIDVFRWVQRGPWFPQIFNQKRMKVFWDYNGYKTVISKERSLHKLEVQFDRIEN